MKDSSLSIMNVIFVMICLAPLPTYRNTQDFHAARHLYCKQTSSSLTDLSTHTQENHIDIPNF